MKRPTKDRRSERQAGSTERGLERDERRRNHALPSRATTALTWWFGVRRGRLGERLLRLLRPQFLGRVYSGTALVPARTVKRR